ncbi:MAG: protease inhibitor I42 family protein [Eubacteriales bacterium]|nr:protease inhibitor I42 family protein [Eubacteriales bacterium]
MKIQKIFIIAFSVVLAIYLVACSSSKDTKQEETTTQAAQEETKGVGQIVEFEVEENGSTGYLWDITSKGNGKVKIAHKNSETKKESEMIPGASHKVVYGFTPIKQGKISIIFKYGRPWENEFDYTYYYNFEIDSSLNIKFIDTTKEKNDKMEFPDQQEPYISGPTMKR